MTDDTNRIDAACDAFESQWQAGARPEIDAHLSGFAEPARGRLLFELIRLDLEFRLRAGEPVRVEEYRTRYPEIEADRRELLDLVVLEHRVRLACGQLVSSEEYFARFPNLRDELALKLPKPAQRLPELPGYEILDELGRGGMGVVYRARDTRLDRVVALKQILHGGDAEERQAFRREAEAIARLHHPGIVQIFEVGEHDGVPYMTLEYCAGGSLATRLGASPLQGRQAAMLVEQLAHAVHAAHVAHVVHRDLKPANVLLVGDTQVSSDALLTAKITDFGLAKRLDHTRHTQTGQMMGTPAYMAPEQASTDQSVGAACDIWALGAILYECLTGRPPFRAATPLSTLRLILETDPVSPRELQPDVPRDLETICLKCLHKEPGRRYASAAELAADLRRWIEGKPIVARPVGRAERTWKWVKRNPVVALLLGLVFFSMSVGTTVSLLQTQEAGVQQIEAKKQAKLANDRAGDLSVQLKESRRSLDLFRLLQSRSEFNDANVLHSRDLLAEIAVENRCLAWHILNERFEGGLFTLYGHSDAITSVAISAEANHIVTGSNDRTARLWEARTGKNLAVLSGHADGVTCVAINRNGKLIVTGSSDGAVRVWDGSTLRKTLAEEPRKAVTSLGLNFDGTRVVACYQDLTVREWDLDEGKRTQLHRFHDIANRVQVAAGGDGSQLVLSTRKGGAHAWDLRTGVRADLTRVFSDLPDLTNACLAGDGTRIVVGTEHGGRGLKARPDLYDPRDGSHHPLTTNLSELFAKPNTSDRHAYLVAMSADGALVVAGFQDGVARAWSGGMGQNLYDLIGHSAAIKAIALSGDGSLIVTGSADHTARVWSGHTGRRAYALHGLKSPVKRVTLSGDGETIVTTHADKSLRTWQFHHGRILREWTDLPSEVNSLSISGDGNWIVTGFKDETGRIWNARTGAFTALPNKERIIDVAISGDGKRIIAGVKSRKLLVWNRETLEPISEQASYDAISSGLAVNGDGTRIIVANSAARVWLLNSTNSPFDLKGVRASFDCSAINSNGTRLVTGSADYLARVWSVDRKMLLELRGHKDQVSNVAISDDANRVITAAKDGSLRIWDGVLGESLLALDDYLTYAGPQTVGVSSAADRLVFAAADGSAHLWDGRRSPNVLEMKGHVFDVISLAVNQDGSRIVTGANDWTARVWNSQTGESVFTLQGHTHNVAKVAFSRDGSQIVTQDADGKRLVWDAATGEQIDVAEPPALLAVTDTTPDGRYRFIPAGKRVRRVLVGLDEAELARRRWLTRPDPEWNVKQTKSFAAPGFEFNAALHRSFEHRARGWLALDEGDAKRAESHSIAASDLMPRPVTGPKLKGGK